MAFVTNLDSSTLVSFVASLHGEHNVIQTSSCFSLPWYFDSLSRLWVGTLLHASLSLSLCDIVPNDAGCHKTFCHICQVDKVRTISLMASLLCRLWFLFWWWQ